MASISPKTPQIPDAWKQYLATTEGGLITGGGSQIPGTNITARLVPIKGGFNVQYLQNGQPIGSGQYSPDNPVFKDPITALQNTKMGFNHKGFLQSMAGDAGKLAQDPAFWKTMAVAVGGPMAGSAAAGGAAGTTAGEAGANAITGTQAGLTTDYFGGAAGAAGDTGAATLGETAGLSGLSSVAGGAPVYDASGNLVAAPGQAVNLTGATSAANGALPLAGSASNALSSAGQVGAGQAATSFADFVKSYGPTLAQLGIGGAGLVEAYQQNKNANQALDNQEQAQQDSLEFQREQLAAAKDLGQQSIDLSKQEYQNRLDIGKRIEDNATLDPSYINSEAARAGVTSDQQYANRLAQEQRGLSRMGVDPSSGRYAGSTRAADLEATASKVGEINNTRTGLVNYARGLKSQALSAELGISNPAIETTGQQSSQATQIANQAANTGLAYSNIYGNQANQSSANAQDALNSGLSAFSTIMDRNNKAA